MRRRVYFSDALILTCSLMCSLTLARSDSKKSYTLAVSDFLHSPHIQRVKVSKDPTYPHAHIEYTAVPFSEVIDLEKLDADAQIQFNCANGFASVISVSALKNKKAGALLAIEDPAHPWPKLESQEDQTAGPFYLIWEHPEKAGIGREQWPFQIVSFQVQPSFSKQFPHLDPTFWHLNPNQRDAPAIQKGAHLFAQNCFVCHRFNGDGQSNLGPDLNLPMNPTEYFSDETLKKLIRDPQQVRRWPQAKMKGFNASALSDSDVAAILTYLHFMKNHKINTKETDVQAP